jgi:hypothetical protein
MSSTIIHYPFRLSLTPSVVNNNISNPVLTFNDVSSNTGIDTTYQRLSVGTLYTYNVSNTTTYYSISFTTNSNYFCDITDISFNYGKTSNGPMGYKIRTNQDNYTQDISSVTIPFGGSGGHPTRTARHYLSFNGITNFGLRIYVYGGLNRIFHFREFFINGRVYFVQPARLPAPTPISNICFIAGTPITCNQGNIPIENINPDIHTIRNKNIIGITKTITQDKYLICFEKDALGINFPSQKTIISKNHRILYRGNMRKAKEFVEISDKVYKIKYRNEVLYNVLMEEHDKIVVNNLICETLHPENGIARLYRKLQKLNPEQQNELINNYNECAIKNNTFTSKKLISQVINL